MGENINNVMGKNGYFLLKDLKFHIHQGKHEEEEEDDDDAEEVEEDGGSFCFCFWVFLQNPPTSFPFALLHQVHPDVNTSVPFLELNESKNLRLSTLHFVQDENPSLSNSWFSENVCVSAESEFPIKKWVHVGCEVSIDYVRLHINGLIVGEKSLKINPSQPHCSRKVSLDCSRVEVDKNYKIQGYVHGLEVLPLTSSIKDYYVKDPPVQLFIDSSSVSDIEEDNDGVWNIVGGKASCRRNFSLDVVLLDGVSQPVDKELEVVATLLYAEGYIPVDKPRDGEAPLLTDYEGIEFASWDRPSKLINGRASFKLKISQLSAKCDNKLFRIRFDVPRLRIYPFLETFSNPIRCISRNRSSDVQQSIVREEKQNPSSKRVKLRQESGLLKVDILLEQVNKGFNPPAWKSNEDHNAYDTSLRKLESHVDIVNSSPGSEGSEATTSIPQSMSNKGNSIPDSTVFRYCLGSLAERGVLLKEIAMASSELELVDFAEQVSLYSGCSHHRQQIIIAKRLMDDGVKAWLSISDSNHHVLWENIVSGIEEQFKKISCCGTRYLSAGDLEILRRIAGCHELVARENFEKLWCWLYPVALSLSRESLNALWDSVLPKWIEGFITKEEAEYSLQAPGGVVSPGTFILRFPVSRSWPHPDAGNLVVSYLGSDYTIHHRMLSLDFINSSGANGKIIKPLRDLLLEEPGLSRLGRVRRFV